MGTSGSAMARFGLVIWDFDGTILDTETPTFEAASREYQRYGLEPDLAVWQDTLGSAQHEPWWEDLRRRVGGLDESDEDLFDRYGAEKDALIAAADLRPGVRSSFDSFAEAGIPVALASSSPIEWVEGHTKRHQLWDSFVAVATRTDVGADRTKPHPDLFLLAADRAGVAPADCLVIEDSNHGVAAAKAAGMKVVAFPNPMTSSQDFSDADLVVHTLVGLRLEDIT